MGELRPKAPVKLYVYTVLANPSAVRPAASRDSAHSVRTPGIRGSLSGVAPGSPERPVWITACPEWDESYWRREHGLVLRWLAGPLYPEAAYALDGALQTWAQGALADCLPRRFWARWRVRQRFGADLLRTPPEPLFLTAVDGAGAAGNEGPLAQPPLLADLLPLLGGRWLTWREISALGARLGHSFRSVELTQALQWALLHHQLEVRPGLRWDERRGAWQCGRCGSWWSDDQEEAGFAPAAAAALTCPDCGRSRELCHECPACAALGPVRACTLLFRSPLPPAAPLLLNGRLQLPFALTPEQQEAAAALCRFCREATARYGCVEAVCGAGKTEIVLDCMVDEWARGGRVLLAIPRREIVTELSARLRSYLPADVPAPIALYGGSSEIWTAPTYLTVATTHQALRFDGAFSLTILDEADAYPYRGTPLLEQAVERATLPTGKIIYLSATPSAAMLRAVQRQGGVHLRLVARPHRRALPEPILLAGNRQRGDRSGQAPQVAGCGTSAGDVAAVLDLLWSKTAAGQPLFVFVPFVRALGEVCAQLQAVPALAGLSLTSCHAHDPERGRKCEQFRARVIRIMVCTTILERGVTVAEANVLVWAADEESVFDAAALTQMAGRAGRGGRPGPGNPGLVVFWGTHRVSRAMHQAYATIHAANQRALAQGLLP